jgi:hypothetical protein
MLPFPSPVVGRADTTGSIVLNNRAPRGDMQSGTDRRIPAGDMNSGTDVRKTRETI